MAFKMRGWSGYKRGTDAAEKDSLKNSKENEKYAYLKGKSISETTKNLFKNPGNMLDIITKSYITTGKNIKNYFTAGKKAAKDKLTK